MSAQSNKHFRPRAIGFAVAGGLLLSGLAAAPSRAGDVTEDLVKLLESKGMLTTGEAAGFIDRLKKESAVTQPAGAKHVTVVEGGAGYLETVSENVARDIKADVKQEVKNELREEIARDIKIDAHTASVPDWTKRIRFGGDIRVRHQSDYFPQGNAEFVKPDKPSEILNSTVDRHRERYRIRLGAKMKVNDQVEGEVKVATGNETDPVSTNDTLGDTFNKDTVTFDLGYIRWKPFAESTLWAGEADLTLGRMPNPFLSSDLVWDRDVNLEGMAFTSKIPIGTRLKGLLAAGAFPLQEVEVSGDDKWLYAGQVGLEYAPRTTFNFQLAASYYDYRNIEGAMNVLGLNTNDFTAPQFIQKGNALFDINPLPGLSAYKAALVMDYNLFNVTAIMDLGFFDPIHVMLLGDYVKNVGYNEADIFSRTGLTAADILAANNSSLDKNNHGYQYGIAVGYPTIQALWDWRLSAYYKYLESDAVLDAFTDSDFHGGGTNAKGWSLGLELGLHKNVWVAGKWLSTNEVTGAPFAIDTLQVDVNAKF